MTRTFHLLTGEYPPQTGGVGDYTRIVARGLAARGFNVHVWCPEVTAGVADLVHLHSLPDRFGPGARDALASAFAAAPGAVVVQYVPNAFGARGANVAFCLWLLGLHRQAVDVRVMFHEPYFYFSRTRPSRNLLAAAQRVMAALLLKASPVAYISTATWQRYLRPWGARAFVELPIPATIASTAGADEISRWRATLAGTTAGTRLVGHFGTFGDHVARELEPAIVAVLDAAPDARFVCIGRGAEAFAARLRRRHTVLGPRIVATREGLSGEEVAAVLGACDVALQPYPDGVTTRRTSVMAALANGIAVVTTDGALTEPIWRATGAVSLAPAGAAQALGTAVSGLLADAAARTALAERGRRVYEDQFAIGHTLDRLAGREAA